MNNKFFKQSLRNQFIICILVIASVSAVCFLLSDTIGYRAVALILMATVSILAIFFTVYPVLLAATLSALIWDYFFIPPHFTLHVGSSEDILMLLMYFIIALINGVLTSQVRELEKLELQKEERHNTIKLYKTLFDSISHELRTPIATIVGASDNLQQNNANLTNEDKSSLINEISIAAFRLNRLIDNLLNMQRLESGMLKTKLDWVDINELISTPVNRLKDELSSHRVDITIQDDFPIIKLDFGLIEQALFNILHNESLYTPANSIINIDASYEKGKLLLTVSDDGKGFTEEELQYLFSKFYRASVKTTGGTGLGLSIVKGFVEVHGGRGWVENVHPHGAKFCIEIPSDTLELYGMLDFTDMAVKQNRRHETLSDTYIPKKKDGDTPKNTLYTPQDE